MKMKRSISVSGIVVFSLYFLWTTMAIALASPQDESAHAMVMDKGGWVALESKDGGGEIRMEGEGMEIVTPQLERRIEMDYNATPVPVESLLNFLRRLRARLVGGFEK